ncbi:hypothetical protein [Sphingopyxis sp. 550A]
MTNLSSLIERIEADGAFDRGLNEEVAQVFGWHVRKVTRLGLNGRTPGSWIWFPPNAPFGHKGSRMPHNFIGPRSRVRTLERLRALKARNHSHEG